MRGFAARIDLSHSALLDLIDPGSARTMREDQQNRILQQLLAEVNRDRSSDANAQTSGSAKSGIVLFHRTRTLVCDESFREELEAEFKTLDSTLNMIHVLGVSSQSPQCGFETCLSLHRS